MTGGETVVITDNESGKTLLLMGVMGENYAVQSDGEKTEEEEKLEYKATGEEKEVNGYTCTVAEAENDGSTITVCYTDELPAIESDKFEGINGIPVEVVLENESFTMIQRVKEVQKGKVDKIQMEVPEGYKEMTPGEFKQKFGGIGM